MALTAEQILNANDLSKVEVNVPEWGGTVFVRIMTVKERFAFETEHVNDRNGDLKLRIVAATICDENGTPLFNKKQLEALLEKSGVALNRVFFAGAKLNGILPQGFEEVGNC